jgi:hypothetical protein
MGYTHYTRSELAVIRRQVKAYINATPGWRNITKGYKKRGFVKAAAQELSRPLTGVWALFNDMVVGYGQKTKATGFVKTARRRYSPAGYEGLQKNGSARIKLVKEALVAAGLTAEQVEAAFRAKPAKLPKEFYEQVNARVSRRETFSVRVSYSQTDGEAIWGFNPVVYDREHAAEARTAREAVPA